MNGLVWFLLGAFVGFDAAIAYAWHTIRRGRRSDVVERVNRYTSPWRTW